MSELSFNFPLDLCESSIPINGMEMNIKMTEFLYCLMIIRDVIIMFKRDEMKNTTKQQFLHIMVTVVAVIGSLLLSYYFHAAMYIIFFLFFYFC